MNNLKYYNDSLAYDFQMFMPKEKPQSVPKDNVIKMPRHKNKSRRKTAAAQVSASAFSIVTSIVIV